jgi:hypothetical protein
MHTTDPYLVWQTYGIWAATVAAGIAAFLAYKIGNKQNIINERALKISDFVELFFMPQQVIDPKTNRVIGHNILVKNASSYPVYINGFTLNDEVRSTGFTCIPSGENNWFMISINDEIKQQKHIKLTVEFEDYMGNKYTSKTEGDFDDLMLWLHSKKRIQKT